MIPAKTPKILKQFFSTYTWDLHVQNEKKIYLTFDDGPIPEITEFVLAQLKLYNAKATFFCIGENIKRHPHVFKKIIDHGHAIGNHTMNHLKVWKSNSKTYLDSISDCEELILQHYQTTDIYTKLFRPPYGQISYSKFKTIEKLGYKIILWDVLSKDWDKNILPQECLQNVIKNTESGSIVVFHDSKKASINLKYALPKVLDYFSNRGYTFEAISIKHTPS